MKLLRKYFRSSGPRWAKNLPNLISALRLVMSPYVLLFALRGEVNLSMLLFALLLISDALDGTIARLLGAETRLGRMLDPLADKVLLLCGLLAVTLFTDRGVSILLLKAVVIRDLFLIGGTLFLKRFGFVPSPSLWGKSATVFLGLTVINGYLVNLYSSSLLFSSFIFLQYLSGFLIAVSGIDYALKGAIFLRSKFIIERR